MAGSLVAPRRWVVVLPARVAATACRPSWSVPSSRVCVCSGTTGCPCAHLPAAAQRLVEGDQVGGDGRASSGPGCSAAAAASAARPARADSRSRPSRYCDHGQLAPIARADVTAFCSNTMACLRVEEAGQRVLHLLRRLEHGVAIADEQLLEARVLDAHGVRQAAVVEERPVDLRADRVEDAAGREEVVRRRRRRCWSASPIVPSSEKLG